MNPAVLTPVDSPREFLDHEIFFSTTDRKGTILSGNEVFMRISGYAGADLIGRPHNVIRHPDMPRAVFRLVWDYLRRGRAVAGYVKNMAADGKYYWVVAMITPLRGGFLSVRFKPTSEIRAAVELLYREMRQIERDAEARGEAGGGMDLATDKMLAALRELGFADYDAFMAAMLHAELKSRDATIAARGASLLPGAVSEAATAHARRLQSIYRRCQETYRQLNRLYAELDEYGRLHRELHDGFTGVIKFVQEFRLLALNATVKSAQLGAAGRCIGVIAAYLGEVSQIISRNSGELDEHLKPLGAQLRSAVFNLAAARLQLEMIMLFSHELATVGSGEGVDARHVDDLQAAFDGTIAPAVRDLRQIETALRGFGSHPEEYRKLAVAIQVAQIGGAVEAARLRDDGSLAQTFADVREHSQVFKGKLERLAGVIAHFDLLASAAPAIVRQLSASIELTRGDLKEFLALVAADSAAGSRAAENCHPVVAPVRPSRSRENRRVNPEPAFLSNN
jgi:aerotaxis receptor